MKLTKRLLCALLVLCLLASLLTAFAATGTLTANTGRRHTVCTSLSTKAKAYYSGNYTWDKLSALPGVDAPKDSWLATQDNALYTALQKLMTDTHTNRNVVYSGYNSNSLATYWKKTDSAAGCTGTYMFFYGDVPGSTGGYTMNREHIWCKANASFYQQGGGSDLHHLRPSIDFVNKAKDYYAFGYVKGKYPDATASTVNGKEVCWASKSKEMFEVKDDIKGDVARILLYVYCRWGQPNLYSNVTSTKLPPMDSDDDRNNGSKVAESLDVLLQWMELDPVDEWEMGRNDQTENVQGNRNVFIDYPELAWLMFGRKVPSDMQTPSGEGKRLHYWDEGVQTLAPTCTEPGTVIYTCTECDLTREEVLPALGHEYVRGTCTRCGEADPTYIEPCTGYVDIDRDAWYHNYADFAIEKGLMGSTKTDTLTFEPNTSCTRSMIVAMLYSLAGNPSVTFEGRFSDVGPGQWYSKAVIWAYRNGVVSGYDNGCFGPNDLVTREQLAVILMKYAQNVAGLETTLRANLSDFPDEAKATWSRDAIRWAVAVGLISGKSSGSQVLLDPQGKASRAEAACILTNFLQSIIGE